MCRGVQSSEGSHATTALFDFTVSHTHLDRADWPKSGVGSRVSRYNKLQSFCCIIVSLNIWPGQKHHHKHVRDSMNSSWGRERSSGGEEKGRTKYSFLINQQNEKRLQESTLISATDEKNEVFYTKVKNHQLTTYTHSINVKKKKTNSSVVTSLVLFFTFFMFKMQKVNLKKCGSQIWGYQKKKK